MSACLDRNVGNKKIATAGSWQREHCFVQVEMETELYRAVSVECNNVLNLHVWPPYFV